MSSLSNDQGRAFEYACINQLYKHILSVRKVKIEENEHYDAAKRAWNSIDKSMQQTLVLSADAAIPYLSELEPMIMEAGEDILILQIQPDGAGEKGDVRDILIIRKEYKWEIGLSMKHNHFAVKHSRISKELDFGEKWFGVPCTQLYWNDVNPIFKELEELKAKGKLWSSVTNKFDSVYVPLLKAFIDEISRSYANDNTIPQKMVAYLLGEYDFYKVIGIDSKKETEIDAFNLYGTLNKRSKTKVSIYKIPVAELPTKINFIGMKENSKTTVEIDMNNGWSFSFRIHNAEDFVIPSLKFDIQFLGLPTNLIFTISCKWYND